MNPADDLASQTPDGRAMASRVIDADAESRGNPAAGRLAEGFAQHVERWARRLGCDERHLPVLRLAACATSLATSNGHVCILLSDVTGLTRESLLASGLVGTPELPAAYPLVLDADGRLYLHRYFDYEGRLASRLMQAATAPPRPVAAAARDLLQTLFPPPASAQVDWQRIAAAMALRNGLTVISGGPGTGKTTTVVNLLACLVTQEPHSRIALAAPTGKAAARMTEAIGQRAVHLPAALREKLPRESSTIHRLLGANPGLGRYTYYAGNPLPCDVLIVDEASMLDLALATRLLEAVPASARIILLGDKDQLSAVESGAVFAELCADPSVSEACKRDVAAWCGYAPERIAPPVPAQAGALRDAAVWLTKNYRFGADSGVGRLARYINEGRPEEAIAWLRGAATPANSVSASAALGGVNARKNGKGAKRDDASLPLFPELVGEKRSPTDAYAATSVQWLEPGPQSGSPIGAVIAGYEPYFDAVLADPRNVDAISRAFGSFRVLCAVRQGPSGVMAVNDQLTRHARHVLAAVAEAQATDSRSPWHVGRPVMVLRNDYVHKLFNGDIGVTLPDKSGDLAVFFPDGENGYRAVPTVRMPEHETAFAMTVHKAQGSEFDAALILLPGQRNRGLTRELAYTAVTRARSRVGISAGAEVLASAIHDRSARRSGLMARLRQAAPPPGQACPPRKP